MTYSKSDFNACRFNPLIEEKMLAQYSALNEIVKPEWVSDPWLDAILRYTILVYDPKSVLVINERDVTHRKTEAAQLAGFDMDDEDLMIKIYSGNYEWQELIEDAEFEEDEGEDALPQATRGVPIMLEITFNYLVRFPMSKEWMAIVCFEYKFYEAAKILLTPVTGKSSKEELEALQKKSLVADEFDKDIKRLDALYKAFLSDDTILEKKLKKKRMLRPESVGR